MTEYQPGVCNIGREERRKRRFMGVASAVAAVAFVAFVVATGRPDRLLLLSFPLFFGAAMGIAQDRLRFCAGFGALARYDLSGSGGDAGRAHDRRAVRRDRRQAAKIVGLAAVAAALATALASGLGAFV